VKALLGWLAAALALALLALVVGLLAWSEWPTSNDRGDIHDFPPSGLNTAPSHLTSAQAIGREHQAILGLQRLDGAAVLALPRAEPSHTAMENLRQWGPLKLVADPPASDHALNLLIHVEGTIKIWVCGSQRDVPQIKPQRLSF
jgi:hypothetical protein